VGKKNLGKSGRKVHNSLPEISISPEKIHISLKEIHISLGDLYKWTREICISSFDSQSAKLRSIEKEPEA